MKARNTNSVFPAVVVPNKTHLFLLAGQLALLARSQLVPTAAVSHHLVPYRGQQTSSTSVPARRGRLDNSAEFVVTKLDDLINWARKVRREETEM